MERLNKSYNEYKKELYELESRNDLCQHCKYRMPDSLADIANYTTYHCQVCEFQKVIDRKALLQDIIVKINSVNRVWGLLPVDYINRRIEDYKDDIQKQVKNFLHSDNLYLFIFSKYNGTGKTSLMWSINKYQSMRSYYLNSVVNESELDVKFSDIDKKYFYIDDVGKVDDKYKKTVIQQYYYEVINYAKENHKKMIITTNKQPDEFVNWIDNKELRSAVNERLRNRTVKIELNEVMR